MAFKSCPVINVMAKNICQATFTLQGQFQPKFFTWKTSVTKRLSVTDFRLLRFHKTERPSTFHFLLAASRMHHTARYCNILLGVQPGLPTKPPWNRVARPGRADPRLVARPISPARPISAHSRISGPSSQAKFLGRAWPRFAGPGRIFALGRA